MRITLLVLICVLLSGCFGEARKQRHKHAAQMFANILITSQAQRAENAPPVHQTAQAIETAAKAGLKVLDYELEK